MTRKTYDLLIAEEYEHEGETKARFHNVGTAWPLEGKDGMSVQLHPGIAISGRLVILPRKARSENT